MSTPFLDITTDHVDKSPARRWLNSQWDFVRSHLPPAPARVIDLGCGPHAASCQRRNTPDTTPLQPRGLGSKRWLSVVVYL
jgi:hypothetical protein